MYLTDESVVFEGVSVLFGQFTLDAWVDLDKDDFVHRKSHNPDVVAVVDMVQNVVWGVNRKL